MSEPPPPPHGRVLGLINAARSLTLFNVLVVALLVAILIPVYVVWKTLSDPEGELLDRFLSSYREIPSDTGCTVRAVAERGGPERWAISTGFAAAGADQWNVSAILDHSPTEDEIGSFCASLLLIVDKMHNGGSTDAP